MKLMKPITNLLVLGGGSAGFLAAITLKTKLPHLPVTVLRSPDLGIIGVGEGTTTYVPEHLHGYLGIPIREFYAAARPSWKLGIRFLWGPRPFFNYTFTYQIENRHPGLSKSSGYYLDEQFEVTDLASALMTADRAFAANPDGVPHVFRQFAYHLENETFVAYLEKHARTLGIQIVDDRVVEVQRGEEGIQSLRLESGRSITADLFLDCSGFRSELIGKALAEPFISFRKSLFCDRAVVGGWARTDETILPYTVAETMNSGWCWQIEHEHRINRGYVYSSDFISDAEAEAEFRRKCPKVERTRVVPFISGRRERSWVNNVIAIGNASGFVEPLESTSLLVICMEAQVLAETLMVTESTPGVSSVRQYNRLVGDLWDIIRQFLAVHYRFNTRLDTPFWRACRADVDLVGAAEIVEYYQDNGPQSLYHQTLVKSIDPFHLEGYYTLLLGQKVPHARPHEPTIQEKWLWHQKVAGYREEAARAYTVREALDIVHSPEWIWNSDFYRDIVPPQNPR